jgi:hypothetical protein
MDCFERMAAELRLMEILKPGLEKYLKSDECIENMKKHNTLFARLVEDNGKT